MTKGKYVLENFSTSELKLCNAYKNAIFRLIQRERSSNVQRLIILLFINNRYQTFCSSESKALFNSFYLAGERLKRKIKALRFVRIMRFSKAFSKKLYFWLSCMITQLNFCSAFNWAIYILEFTLDIAWGYYYFPSWVCLFAGEFFLKRHLRILFKHLFCGWDALNALFTFSFTLNDSTVSLIQWKKICIIQTQKRSWYFLQPEGMRLGAHFSFQNQVTKCDSKEDTSINFIPKTGSYRIAACLVKMVSYVESILWNLSNASKTEGY